MMTVLFLPWPSAINMGPPGPPLSALLGGVLRFEDKVDAGLPPCCTVMAIGDLGWGSLSPGCDCFEGMLSCTWVASCSSLAIEHSSIQLWLASLWPEAQLVTEAMDYFTFFFSYAQHMLKMCANQERPLLLLGTVYWKHNSSQERKHITRVLSRHWPLLSPDNRWLCLSFYTSTKCVNKL